MDIQLTIAQQGATSGYAVINIYDPTAPSVVVQTKNHILPISTTIALDFVGLEDMTYLVRIFISSTPDSADGSQIGSDFYAYPGNSNSAVVHTDLWLVAGITSGVVVGSDTYNNADLIDWKWSLELPGVGTLQPNVDYTPLSGGGFTLLDTVFQDEEKYVIHFEPNITTVKTTSGSGAKGSLFSGFEIITESIALGASDIGKLIFVSQQYGSTPITITLPDINSVPDNTITCFQNFGDFNNMVTIDSGSTINWLYYSSSKLYLGVSEEIWIYKNGLAWYVAMADGNFKSVGEIVYSFDHNEQNCVQANGALVSRAQLPRLWDFITTRLNSSCIVSESNWNNKDADGRYVNHGRYSLGDGVTTFRVPLLVKEIERDAEGNYVQMSGYGFLRGVDSNTTPAGITENDAVGDFYADIEGMTFAKSGTDTKGLICLDSSADSKNNLPSIAQNRTFNGKTLSNSVYSLNHETRPGAVYVYQLIKC